MTDGKKKQAKRQRGSAARPAGTAPRGGVGSTRVRDRSRLSERMGRKTRARLFAQALVPDFLLVLLVSSALAYTVSYAFESAPDLRSNAALIALLDVPLLAAMFWGTWSKRMLAPSIVATALVAAAIVGAAIALSPPGGEMFTGVDAMDSLSVFQVNDVPENRGIFAMVVVACAVLAFLLSRRTVGLVFLLVLSVVACGAVQFLYRDWVTAEPGIPATLAVLFGLGMLFVYQCYRQSVYSANRVKRTSFGAAFAFSALVGLACVLVGTGVFYGVVAGMDLATPEIKPFESYVSPPESDNPEDMRDQSAEGEDTSDDTTEDDRQDGEENEADDTSDGNGLGFLEDTVVADAVKALMNYDADSDDVEDSASLPLILTITAIVIAALVLLAVVAVVLLWRGRRALRLRLIARRSNRYQVWYLYTFLTGRLGRLRMGKPASLTPMEYALGFERPMAPFARDTGGVDFVDVTEIYEDAAYGAEEPPAEDVEAVVRYYRAFFKNARIHVGWPKWILWKFWRI